uniref:Ig-like domain-containing protein n=1 Tax=Poecilia reticulata TaxID=8081 RepID=A0A3P9NJI2_POERE
VFLFNGVHVTDHRWFSGQPVVAAPGDDVILQCLVEPQLDMVDMTVEWSRPDAKHRPKGMEYVHLYRDNNEVLDMKSSSYYGRTALFADGLRHGNISLIVTNVTTADDGEYKCFIPKLHGNTKSSVVRLIVAVSGPVSSLRLVLLIIGPISGILLIILLFYSVSKVLSSHQLADISFKVLLEIRSINVHVWVFADSRVLTLDIQTAHKCLSISKEQQQEVGVSRYAPYYVSRSDMFESVKQVLCCEALSERCYWEVTWEGSFCAVAVAYKDIGRSSADSEFGCNDKSWSLECSKDSYVFRHCCQKKVLSGPLTSWIGVYLDYRSGTLAFYSISKEMVLLHREKTMFCKPLYPGLPKNKNQTPAKLNAASPCLVLVLLCIPRTRTKHGEAAFSFYAPQIWNKLPENCKKVETLSSFKSRLNPTCCL